MIKSLKEKEDDFKRKQLIEYLNQNGYPSLKFEEDQIDSLMVAGIDQKQISQSVVLFLNSLNIMSGSNGKFDFYKLIEKYIIDSKTREEINKLL